MIYGILICILYCPPNNHPLYYLRMYTEKVWPSHKFSLFNYNTLLYVHQKIIQDWWSQRHNIVKNIVGKFSDSKAVDRFFLFSLSSFFFWYEDVVLCLIIYVHGKRRRRYEEQETCRDYVVESGSLSHGDTYSDI